MNTVTLLKVLGLYKFIAYNFTLNAHVIPDASLFDGEKRRCEFKFSSLRTPPPWFLHVGYEASIVSITPQRLLPLGILIEEVD